MLVDIGANGRDDFISAVDHCRGEATRIETSIAKEPMFRVASPLPFDKASFVAPHGVESGSIGAIIGNYKALVTKRVNNIRRTPGAKLWRRGYYNRIVRNERELNAIRQYIINNPLCWNEDRENLDTLIAKMRLVIR